MEALRPEDYEVAASFNPWRTKLTNITMKYFMILMIGLLAMEFDFGELAWFLFGFSLMGWAYEYVMLMTRRQKNQRVLNQARDQFIRMGNNPDMVHQFSDVFWHFTKNPAIQDFAFTVFHQSQARIVFEPKRAHWEFRSEFPMDTPPIIRYYLTCLASVMIENFNDSVIRQGTNEIIYRTQWFDVHPDIAAVFKSKRRFFALFEHPPEKAPDRMSFAPGGWVVRMGLVFCKQQENLVNVHSKHYLEKISADPVVETSSEKIDDYGLYPFVDGDEKLEVIKTDRGLDVCLISGDGKRGEVLHYPDREAVLKTWGSFLRGDHMSA